jgi:hypothetical protein
MDVDGDSDDEMFLDLNPHMLFPSVPEALTNNVVNEEEEVKIEPTADVLLSQLDNDDDKDFVMERVNPPINESEPANVEDTYPTNSMVTVEGLLRSHRTSGAHWTHLITWPDEIRSCITNPSDASTLYRSMSAYNCIGMGIMERRLSTITRMSMRILLNNVISPTDAIETNLVHQIAMALQQIISKRLAHSVPMDQRRCCLILRPDDVACHPQEYIFHWPCIAVSSSEFTTAWCDEIRVAAALPAVIRSIIPRNTGSYYPMYGCCATAAEPRMLLRWVVNACGTIHTDWLQWFRDPQNRTHEVLSVGHGNRCPQNPSNDTIHRCLPLICSINPMGTEVCLLHRDTIRTTDAGDASLVRSSEMEAMYAALDRALKALSPERIASVTLSNEVGEMIYAATCGASWGCRMWMAWMRESRTSLSVQCELELLSQWASFAHHPGGMDGLLRLKCLVRRDSTKHQWIEFLRCEREADHRDRHCTNPISAAMGSLTHMDLAKFVWHQLNETVQCTSTAGRGLWYVYKQRIRRILSC